MTNADHSILKSRMNYAALLIWLSLALLATGVEVGGSLQPSRIVIVAAAVLMLLKGKLLGDLTRPTRFFVLVAVAWLLWGATSLFWTPDLPAGVREMIGVCLGFLTVVTLLNLARSTPDVLRMIRLGWLASFLFTVPIAIYEIVTDQHMPQSYGQLTLGGLENAPIIYASTTFGNRNTYIAFVVIALPFILWGFHAARGWLHKGFYLAVVAGAAGLVMLTSSRLAIVATVIELLVWFLLTFNFWKFRNVVTVVLLVSVLAWGFMQISNVSALVQIRILNAGRYEDQSASRRGALYMNGMQFILRTTGIGVGAGGFQQSIENGWDLYDTGGVIDPHNLFLEVFSQYGLVVGGLFFGWLIYCFKVMVSGLRRKRLASSGELELAAKHGVVIMLALLPIALLNSSFLTFTIFWMAVACLTVIADRVWRTLHISVQTARGSN
jgi:teichuronic acid biosynthesis protein TuaE